MYGPRNSSQQRYNALLSVIAIRWQPVLFEVSLSPPVQRDVNRAPGITFNMLPIREDFSPVVTDHF